MTWLITVEPENLGANRKKNISCLSRRILQTFDCRAFLGLAIFDKKTGVDTPVQSLKAMKLFGLFVLNLQTCWPACVHGPCSAAAEL